jgi:hypothetical protein
MMGQLGNNQIMSGKVYKNNNYDQLLVTARPTKNGNYNPLTL